MLLKKGTQKSCLLRSPGRPRELRQPEPSRGRGTGIRRGQSTPAEHVHMFAFVHALSLKSAIRTWAAVPKRLYPQSKMQGIPCSARLN